MKTDFFSTDFRRKGQISSFIKIRPVGAELFHAGGQTDMTKLIVALRNFHTAPKSCSSYEIFIHIVKYKFHYNFSLKCIFVRCVLTFQSAVAAIYFTCSNS
jgi:hypothetical protein